MPKSRDPKAIEAVRKGREELQNPDMAKFDRAMRALLKAPSIKKSQTPKHKGESS